MKKNTFVKVFTFPLLLAAAATIVFCSAAVKSGVQEGLQLCGETLIPSLFLFLCLCNTASPYLPFSRLPFSTAFESIFRLPAAAGTVLTFAYIGGYPAGEILCAASLENAWLQPKQAQRLSLFCCAGGPAFCILAVGEGMCGSRSIGIILYVCNILSQLCIGLGLGFLHRKEPVCKVDLLYEQPPTFSTALCSGMQASIRAMLSICGYVIVFCVFGELLRLCAFPAAVQKAISAVLEVTTGCAALQHNIPFLAAIINFGGLSVFFQLRQYLLKIGTRPFRFLLSRLVSAALGYGFCRAFLWLFPQAVPTMAAAPPWRAFSVSAPLSALLVFSFAVFILDNKKEPLFTRE
ncbi:MAG: hypothetical protein E7517_04320 [Ruminococcaceae bacterium]|nr:hypothetical protein [Oscillospiraceae bacterium]